MKKISPIFGFLISPLVPSVTFSIGALILGMSDDTPLDLTFLGYLFGAFIWFLYGATVAYPATLIIGIPGYLFLKKNNIFNIKAYLIGGLSLGSLAPFLTIPIFGLESVLGFDFYIFLISAIFGVITTSAFWLISVQSPNRSLQSDP